MTSQMNENRFTSYRVEHVISILKTLTLKGDCVDGETMQYILERVGMEDQMLRQLMMSQPIVEVINMFGERQDFESFVK